MFNFANLILIIIAVVIYLTNNYHSRVEMVIFFVFIIPVLSFVIYKKKFSITDKKKFLFSLIITAACIILTIDTNIYGYKNEAIEIINISDRTVTIDGIYLNNVKQKLSGKVSYSSNNRSVSEYRNYNKDTGNYKIDIAYGEIYEFFPNTKAKIKIEIIRDKSDHLISINGERINIEKFEVDLDKSAKAIYNSNYIYEYKNIDNDIYPVYKYLLIVIFFVTYFTIINRLMQNNKKLFLLIPLLLLEFNPLISIDFSFKLLFWVLYCLFVYFCKEKYEITNKWKMMFLCFISMYISFSFLGAIIINDSMSFVILITFIFFSVWLYHLIPLVLSLIHKINYHNTLKISSNKSPKYHRFIIFGIIVLIGLVYQKAFNPYIITADSYVSICDILQNEISDWQPYMYGLFLKLFYTIFQDFKFFIYFRLLIYGLIVTQVMFYFNRKGLSLKKVYLISIIFSLLPTTGIYLVTIMKDIEFTLALVHLTFLLYMIFTDFNYFHMKLYNYITLVLSLLAITLFRHNGMFIAIIVCMMLLIFTFKNKYKLMALSMVLYGAVAYSILAIRVFDHNSTFIIAIACTILLFFTFKSKYKLILVSVILYGAVVYIATGPLLKKLNIQQPPRGYLSATMLHGLDRLMYIGSNEINKEVYDFFTDIKPAEDWKFTYDKYDIDLLFYYSGIISYKMEEIHKSNILTLYLKQMMRTPVELLKDRLYGTDIMWNVFGQDEIKTYKYYIYYDEHNYYKLLGITRTDNVLTDVISDVLLFLAKNRISDALFFRTGIYISFGLILILFCNITKQNILVLCLVPILINVATLFLSMHNQLYRYVLPIQLIVLLFMMIVLTNENDKILE